MKKLSANIEDYLVTIRDLVDERQSARVSDIADRMSVSRPSVTQVVTRLTRFGLVNHEHYGDVFITDTGREIADSVSYRRDLFKQFLVDILRAPEKAAEKDACKLGHSIGEDCTANLANFVRFVDAKKNPPIWLKLFHNYLEKVTKEKQDKQK